MTKVYDIKKVREREGREPSPPLFTLQFGKKSHDIPAPVEWPDELFLLAEGDVLGMSEMIRIAKGLLGEFYEAWSAQGLNALDFWNLVREHVGDAGESSASTDS